MKLKNNRAITLIALVVTIIVLLILAGVSLSLVAGSNGILSKAERAVSVTNEATILEEVQLALSEGNMEYYLSDRSLTLDKFLSQKFSPYQTGSGATITFVENGEISYTKGSETIQLEKDANGNIAIAGKTETKPTPEPSVIKSNVTYNLNGGTGTVPEGLTNVAQGTNVIVDTTAIPTKEGYDFLGWALTNDATEAITEFIMPGNDVTLYAVWETHTHSYVETELKDCSETIKAAYKFRDDTITNSCNHGPESIALTNAKVGEIVYVPDTITTPFGNISKGYHIVTAPYTSSRC